ncbi:DciA family protein [Geotoga petraea]|uniref:DUF721 domain-containing protein n=2 Tax=Geotoga petraea TaxID=28234 RepID=A0A4Z0W281_9BACT|nr:DciA family protein [Geotoga petraea]TGG87349.1 DUF721 domain-containing protein [Geotoga petraea]
MEEKMGDFLKRLSKKNPIIKKSYSINEIKKIWEEIADENLKEDTEIKDYFSRDKLLIISCKNNVVMQEIVFNSNEIIENINKKLSQDIVNEIKVIRRCNDAKR